MELCLQQSYRHLFFLLALGFLAQETMEAVWVEYASWAPKFNSSDSMNTSVWFSNDKEKGIPFKCCAYDYPVEWIYPCGEANWEPINERRLEWSDRNVVTKHKDVPSLVEYCAWILLTAYFDNWEILICKSVSNDTDNIFMQIIPNNTVGVINVVKEGVRPHYSSRPVDSSTCSINFTVSSIGNDYYWKCTSENGRVGRILFFDCVSAPYCANMYRHLRSTACVVNVGSFAHGGVNEIGSDWFKMHNLTAPGVAFAWINERRAVVEYFFTAPEDGSTPRRKLHFSWNEIQPADMIWMDVVPLKETYFTPDIINVTCHVPKYGFSYGSTLQLWDEEENHVQMLYFDKIPFKGNSDLLTVDKMLELGSGTNIYTVNCTAPIWNTTEWATLTRKFPIKNPIGPSFEIPVENVTFEEGATGQVLHCELSNPGDDPAPDISWGKTKGVRISKNDPALLEFDKITYERTNGQEVSCVATNKYGQAANKTFRLQVARVGSGNEGASAAEPRTTISTTLVIVIVVTVIVLIGGILLGGVLFLQHKFRNFGTHLSAYLTSEEVKLFIEGKAGESSADATNKDGGSLALIDNLPYDTSFELPRDNLIIDFATQLGSGAYGNVFMGKIKDGTGATNRNSMQQVAVKTIRKEVHVNYFKALLSELKILIYVGRHENIVNLIGAATSNIKNRELFVAVELCQTSMLKFLRSKKSSFVHRTASERVREYENQDYAQRPTTVKNKPIRFEDLVQFSLEIVTGMEFLSEKKVVHGDLAARNVLITFDWHAKICDFGLSMQLIDYNYVKSKQCPLPWKWMAIESLSQMKFSTMSDVWSFGVTMWEIFSLGDIPYPGLAWTLDFVSILKNGLRMGQPVYANSTLYDIMVSCWNDDPQSRPTFKELKKSLQALSSSNGSQNASSSTGVETRDAHYV